MDIRLTPAPLSLHRLFKSSDWSLCQFHCSSIPSQSYVTNYPALSVLVSVIQSLHQCFQHVSHLCLSDVVCLVVPAHYLSVVEICKLWFTLFLVPSRACSAVYFLVFFFCQFYTFSQCLSSSPPSFFPCNCSDFTLFGVQDKMAQISVTLHFTCILNHLVSCSFFSPVCISFCIPLAKISIPVNITVNVKHRC